MVAVGTALPLVSPLVRPIVNGPAGISAMPGGAVATWLAGIVPVRALVGMVAPGTKPPATIA